MVVTKNGDSGTSHTQNAVTTRKIIDKRLMKFPLTHIRVDPNQPRKVFDDKIIDELARNMAAVGQLVPVIGYLDPTATEYLLLEDGECRLRAARRIPLDYLDAIVLAERPSSLELLLTQLTVNQ